MKTTHIYTIRCLTNTHPGSGDTNFGLVDKLVQRDPITNAPTIHASSLKGAIRQYFADQIHPSKGHSDSHVISLFGSPPKNEQIDTAANNPQKAGLKQGNLRFLSADLLLLPIMSDAPTTAPYDLYYEAKLYKEWYEKINLMLSKDSQLDSEWLNTQFSSVKESEAEKVNFKSQYNDLPVVARNYLENGVSENLWYEEIVPRESVFGFAVRGDDACLQELAAGWSGVNGIDDNVVQIGGNATVGYGYCLLKKRNP